VVVGFLGAGPAKLREMSSADSPVTRVRPATVEDVAELDRFVQPFVEQKKLLPRTIEELGDLVGHGFIAEREGRIVGFAALEVYSKKLAEVRSLAVLPGLQGQGIGKQLVQACVDRAREKNILEVMAITSSEEFFRACGFDFTLPGEKKALFLQTREL
jgi:N-acetylglutamate synthase-like GNAT family acetyltransferase